MFNLNKEELVALKDEEFWAQFFERLIKRCLLLIVFMLPIFINPLGFHIFTLPKAIFLRVMTLTIFFSWLSAIIFGRRDFRCSFLDKPLALYLCAATISVIFSLHFHTAFYGAFYRWEGYLSLLIYVFLFYATLNFFQDSEDAKLLVSTLFLSACAVSFVGILQVFHTIFYDPYVTGLDVGRIGSFLGQSNYLGAYLTLIVPLALAYSVFGEGVSFSRGLSLVAFVLSSVCLLLTHTRASWIGVILGVSFMIAMFRKEILKQKLVLIIAVAVLIGFLVFGLVGLKGWQLIFERLSSVIKLQKGSVATRLFIWQVSLKIASSHFLVGVGQDNLGLVFPRYLPINWLAISERAFTDKAHSDILQVVVCQGIVGLVAYIWLFVSLFVVGFKKIIRSIQKEKRFVLVGLFCSVLAYFINLQFSFTMVEVTPIFWILMGLFVGLVSKGAGGETRIVLFQKPESLLNYRKIKFLLLVLLGILFLWGVYGGARAMLADAYIRDACEWSEVGDSEKEVEQYLSALRLNPSESKIFYFLGRAYLDRAREKQDIGKLEKTITAFKRGISLNSYEILNYLGLERAYFLGGKTFDKAMLDKSIEIIKEGLKIAPYLPELWCDLGQAYEGEGLVEEAIEAYTMSLRIDTANEFARDRIKLLKGETDE